MHRTRPRRTVAGLIAILLAAIAATPANAEGAGNILYHEPLQPLPATDSSRQLIFDALGRRFELNLERNRRMQRRVRIGNIEMLQGEVAGQPGSWVRLVRTGEQLSGMFSDGRELFVIEPWADVAEDSVAGGDNAGAINVVFRLQDVMLPQGAASCGYRSLSTLNAEVRGDIAYAELMDELEDMPVFEAAGAARQISLQAVADYEFFERWGDNSEAQILARLNVVDGIFTDQFDLEIEVGAIDIFDTPADPFTTTVPRDLLEEVSDYRRSSSTGDGITHLFSWQNLDGTTRGIAYLGSACMTRFGASLSQQFLSSLTTGALIVAHELGHNFGAQHDGETPEDPGLPNPCENVPETFLMAPIIGTSSTFSQCSLDTMEAFLTLPQASCVTAVGVRLQGVDDSIVAQVDVPEELDFSVENVGGGDATGVQLTFDYPVGLDLLPQNLACNVGLGAATCDLGTLVDGSQRPVSFLVQSSQLGDYDLDIELSTDADANADSATVTITVQATAPVAQGGGGGGGGGSLGGLSIGALLAGGWALRRRRTRPSQPRH